MSQATKYLLRNCIVCGKAFRTSRYHAKTCSNACRMKHSRAGQKKSKLVPGQTVTNVTDVPVTLSYLEWLVSKELSANTPEDWQNQ